MGKEPSDYDITTSAPPDEIKRVFADCKTIDTGLKHGTVTVIWDGISTEITTYRIDGGYSDGRRPDKVEFTRSLEEDLARRDFTMNAMAYNPRTGIVDPFGGQEDIEKRLIRCVGEADRRFEEDGLRIMRALRFASVTGFDMEAQTFEAAKRLKTNLHRVSIERIREELIKLLCGKYVRRVLTSSIGVLAEIMPELGRTEGFDQKNEHHIYDVLEHTAATVEAVRSEPDLRLASLLHDIGKPLCFSTDSEGVGHFYNHSKIGKEIAEEVLDRLKIDNNTKKTVITLVGCHDMQIEPTERGIKRALNKLTPEVFFKLIELKRADNKAQSPNYSYRQDYYDELVRIGEEIIAKEECFDLRSLKVGGDDLLRLGVEAGPIMGKILKKLLKMVIEGEISNEKEDLEREIVKLYKDFKKSPL